VYTHQELVDAATSILLTRKLRFTLEGVRIDPETRVARFSFRASDTGGIATFDCGLDATSAELEGAIAVQLESARLW
jgi:hypothetical protein